MPHAHHASVEFSWIAAGLILVALVYLRGLLRLRRLDLDGVQAWHAGGFILGLFLVWLATASTLSTLDHESLTAHMVQHLLLITFAPPLILLGASLKTLFYGLPRRFVLVMGRSFQSTGFHHLWGALAHPAICWLGAAGTLIAWHIPAVFVLGLQSGTWHGMEQALFLGTGLLFWWPVVRPWPSARTSPRWSMLVYLFLATLPCDILSGFLVFCDRVVYSVYLSTPNPFGFSSLLVHQCP